MSSPWSASRSLSLFLTVGRATTHCAVLMHLPPSTVVVGVCSEALTGSSILADVSTTEARTAVQGAIDAALARLGSPWTLPPIDKAVVAVSGLESREDVAMVRSWVAAKFPAESALRIFLYDAGPAAVPLEGLGEDVVEGAVALGEPEGGPGAVGGAGSGAGRPPGGRTIAADPAVSLMSSGRVSTALSTPAGSMHGTGGRGLGALGPGPSGPTGPSPGSSLRGTGHSMGLPPSASASASAAASAAAPGHLSPSMAAAAAAAGAGSPGGSMAGSDYAEEPHAIMIPARQLPRAQWQPAFSGQWAYPDMWRLACACTADPPAKDGLLPAAVLCGACFCPACVVGANRHMLEHGAPLHFCAVCRSRVAARAACCFLLQCSIGCVDNGDIDCSFCFCGLCIGPLNAAYWRGRLRHKYDLAPASCAPCGGRGGGPALSARCTRSCHRYFPMFSDEELSLNDYCCASQFCLPLALAQEYCELTHRCSLPAPAVVRPPTQQVMLLPSGEIALAVPAWPVQAASEDKPRSGRKGRRHRRGRRSAAGARGADADAAGAGAGSSGAGPSAAGSSWGGADSATDVGSSHDTGAGGSSGAAWADRGAPGAAAAGSSSMTMISSRPATVEALTASDLSLAEDGDESGSDGGVSSSALTTPASSRRPRYSAAGSSGSPAPLPGAMPPSAMASPSSVALVPAEAASDATVAWGRRAVSEMLPGSNSGAAIGNLASSPPRSPLRPAELGPSPRPGWAVNEAQAS